MGEIMCGIILVWGLRVRSFFLVLSNDGEIRRDKLEEDFMGRLVGLINWNFEIF